MGNVLKNEDKRYNVLDGLAIIAEKVQLNVALCLIIGYVEMHPNNTLSITIVSADEDEKKNQHNCFA